MVNPFPDLLSFGILAPFIVRVFLGGYFLLYGYALGHVLLKKKVDGSIFLHSGIALFALFGGLSVLVGFLTQIGAILLLLLSAYLAYVKKDQASIFLSLFAISLSLLFSGAGALAFDVPL